MKAKNKNNSMILVLVASIAWFVVISYVTAHTEYYKFVVGHIVSLQSSAQLKSVLGLLIIIASFIPSGVFLAYPYIKNNFKNHRILRTLLLSIGIALALYMPFGWYNFAINFGN